MAFLMRRAKFLSMLAGALLLVGLLTFGVAKYFAIKMKPIVQRELTVVVRNATQQLYQIDFDKISINFLSGNAYLTNVKIKADSAVYESLVSKKLAPNNLYNISLARLEIKNVHPLKIYFKSVLSINQLLFDQPVIVMTNRVLDFNESKPAQSDKSPFDYIKKFLASLEVKSIDFKNAKFTYVDNNSVKPQVHVVNNLNISLKDWLIDANSAADRSRFYLLKDAYLYMNDYSYPTPDSLYFVKAKQFEFSAIERRLKVKTFEVQPRYSEGEFAKARGFATDRYSLQIKNVDFYDVDLHAFIKNRSFLSKKVMLQNGSLAVFYDNAYPKKLKEKNGRFPHQLLQKIGFPLTLDKIEVNNLDISYAEIGKKSGEKGSVTFNQTSGTLLNVTNQEVAKKRNPIAEANFETYLMRQGKLSVGFKFNLAAAKADFSYQGQLLNMDGRQLNYVTKPLALMRIKSGLIRQLAFDIDANEDVAKGKVLFLYNDLSLGLLKRKEGDVVSKRMGVMSLLANMMVIKPDHPGVDGKTIEAPVVYQRNPSSSFFSFVWKTLFQGIKYSVGFTPEKELEVKSYVSQFEKIKRDRDKRRLDR